MSIERTCRVICDQCETFINVNTSCTLEAVRIAEKKGWIDQKVDFYGNTVQFCSPGCQKAFWKRLVVRPDILVDDI